jgi:hypothetical protein
MFVTTHALVGALIAEQMPGHPVAAFALGVASHFLMDIIPHGDSRLYKGYISGAKARRAVAYVLIDSLVALFFVLFLFNTKFVDHRTAITAGIVGGVLPDFLVGVYEVLRIPGLKWFHRLHFFFHNLVSAKKGDLALSTGIAMQMVLLACILSVI